MYQIVRQMPTEGKFIHIWEYNDQIWSETYRWNHDTLEVYNREEDGFEAQYPSLGDKCTNIRYVILGED